MNRVVRYISSLKDDSDRLLIYWVSFWGMLRKFMDSVRKWVFIRIRLIMYEFFIVFSRFFLKLCIVSELVIVVSSSVLNIFRVVVLVGVVKLV